MLCASDWKHSCGPRRLLLAALLSLTVAKNAVAPQADPSTLERVSTAKAGVIGVQMRKAHRPLAKTDEGWQNALDCCAGRRQAALGAVVRRYGISRYVGRLESFGFFYPEGFRGCVQAIYEGMDPRRSEGLGDEDYGPNGCTAARQSL
jgi:hypothetical protein